MTIRDRLTRGFIAGLIARIPMNILSYIFFMLGFTELRLWTGSVLLLERMVRSPSQACLGPDNPPYIYRYPGYYICLFHQSRLNRKLLLKGLAVQCCRLVLSYLGSTLFPVFKIIITSDKTPATNLVSATVFGLVLAWALKWLDHSVKVNSRDGFLKISCPIILPQKPFSGISLFTSIYLMKASI